MDVESLKEVSREEDKLDPDSLNPGVLQILPKYHLAFPLYTSSLAQLEKNKQKKPQKKPKPTCSTCAHILLWMK